MTSTSPGLLAVRCSERARLHFKALRERAEASPGTEHAKLWEAIKKAIREGLSHPHIAFSPSQALRGDLNGIWRDKLGRFRFFYIGSEAKQQVTFLNIGWRKDGSPDDAYEEIKKLLRRTEFDPLFAELGLTKPVV